MKRWLLHGSCLALMMAATFGLSSPTGMAQESDGNWSQWRGPNANGSSATAKPPVEFSSEKNVKWKAEIPGKGSSTPIIWGQYVYVLTAVDTGTPDPAAKDAAAEERSESDRRPLASETAEVDPPTRGQQDRGNSRQGRGGRGRGGRGGGRPSTLHDFEILCFDKDTGEQVWKKTLNTVVPHEAGHNTNNFASTSPVTDGKNIFVNYGSRGVYCLDMNGNVVWKKDFGLMKTRAGFGEGSSPALYEDTLVVPWDHEEQSYMIALDTKSGTERWRVERDEPTTWATPLIVKHGEQVQVITNGMKVRSYDLTSGDLLWECGGQASNPIPTPVQLGDHVICMTGYRGFAIVSMDLDANGDITDSAEVAWSSNDAAPYVPSPVLYDGKLYYTKSNDGMIAARDAKSGDEFLELTRLDGARQVYASPVAADGKIYVCSREGNVLVLKHSKDLEVIATNKMGETIDASPALSGNRIYLRGEKHLFCIEAKE